MIALGRQAWLNKAARGETHVPRGVREGDVSVNVLVVNYLSDNLESLNMKRNETDVERDKESKDASRHTREIRSTKSPED